MGGDQKNTWRERLAAEVEVFGRGDKPSMRAVSFEAGMGPGYLHGVLEDGKEPSIDRLLKICATLKVSIIYILSGIKISPETEELIRLIEEHPDRREALLRLIEPRPSARSE